MQPPRVSPLRHVQLAGGEVSYHVTFDRLDFKRDGSATAASITAVAYLRSDSDAVERPVMFVFNGGPGASAVLQVEGLGPLQRQGRGDNRKLVPNPHSIVDIADLVFIDPPGTGFSRAPVDDKARARYWSAKGDAHAVAAMIRHWLYTHQRSKSPLYIAGESYGGYRLALLAPLIPDLRPDGVLFVSPLLDATSTSATTDNDLGAIFDLPSLAVAAAAHGKGVLANQTPEAAYARARCYALGPYAQALMRGSALPAEQKKTVALHVAGLLGLSPDMVQAGNLRPDVEVFRQSLLETDKQQIGRLDSRVVADVTPDAAASPERPSAANDPALGLGQSNQIMSPLMAEYLHTLFGSGLPDDYVSLNIDIAMAWAFEPDDGRRDPGAGPVMRFNPTPGLAYLARANPDFRVLALVGYYDLAVPALGAWYALHHTAIDPQHIDFRILPTGHAVFGEKSQRPQLHSLLEHFLK